MRLLFSTLILMLAAITMTNAAEVFMTVDGPVPYRVYQRIANGTATIDISGSLAAGTEGKIEVRLTKDGKALRKFGWKELSQDGDIFTGSLSGVPVGGPYNLELKAGREVKTIPGILVGDLWIMAGQSNMEGCGTLITVEEPSDYVNAFYYGDYWATAKDPLCWFDEAIDPVFWSTPDPVERARNAKNERAFKEIGAGPGVRFAKDMYAATGVPVGLIVCPRGGTSLAQWDPKLKEKGGESFYGSMIRRVNAVGGKVAGCLWYQGEADAIDADGKHYKKLTKEFIQSLRTDLSQPDMPFIYVQLGPYKIWGLPKSPRPGWNKVQNEQLQLEKEVKNVAFAAAVDLDLSDPIHLDSVSQSRLGSRLAKLARRLLFREKIEVGPRPAKFEFTDASRTVIRVTYTSVNGSLKPAKNVRGFQIEKNDVPIAIRSSVVEPSGRSVIITLAEPVPDGSNIWYGRGLYPGVNLADEEGFAAPVFGPIKL